MTARLVIISLLTLLAVSCGSRPPVLIADASGSAKGSAADGGGDFEGWADWQAILADPGLPGVDYDPERITVNYRPDAEFGLLGGLLPPPGHRAADQPNPILRQDQRYEAVTDSISARFNIPIEQQVYAHGVLMASYRVPAEAEAAAIIAAIRTDYPAQVLDVTFSRLIRACFQPNDNYYLKSDSDSGGQWGLYRIGIQSAWEQTLGDPQLLVAVVDSGCRLQHEDIGTNVLDPRTAFPSMACDLVEGDNDITDTDGHGTAICAVLAAETDNLLALAGMLPEGRVLPLRIAAGSVTDQAQVVAGCMLAAELGSRIVNLSWAAASGSRQLSAMCSSLSERGVLLMAAAGNADGTARQYPAAYSAACGVAASNLGDTPLAGSSYGDWTELSAPGEEFTVPDLMRDNIYRDHVSGSSLACAVASGAAALLWSADPAGDAAAIRSLLHDSARPLPTGAAPRIDLANAFARLLSPEISLAAPDQIVQSGFMQLDPQITGQCGGLELWIDNRYVMSRSGQPWNMSADLRDLDGGLHSLELRALDSQQQAVDTAGFGFLTAGTVRPMPFTADFEYGMGDMASLDLSVYAPGLQAQLLEAAGLPGLADQAVPAFPGWRRDGNMAWQGSASAYLPADNATGGAALGALVSPAIRLDYAAPTLSFAARWQLGAARTALLLSADDAASWQAPLELSGASGPMAGEQPDWLPQRYDLSAWQGQSVRFMFLSLIPAGQSGSGLGLWLDSFSLATEFQPSLPVIDGVVLSHTVVGSVAGLDSLRVQLAGAKNVQSARYWLDMEPLGKEGGNDVIVTAILGAGLPASLSLQALPPLNRQAVLHVDYFDSQGSHGPRFSLPVWIFMQPGDADADGRVTLADYGLIRDSIGLGTGLAGYDPFLDTDLDGIVSELDAAAVGYFLAAD